MINRIQLFIICLLFVLTTSTCKDFLPFDRASIIHLENQSSELIYFLVSYAYPDTMIPDTYNKIRGVSAFSESICETGNDWNEVFSKLPSDTLSVFVFSADTIMAYDWQDIRSDYRILRRYDLSLDDLDSLGYKITYP